MGFRVGLAASCALVALPWTASIASAQDRALALTIYADDLALVQDKRPVEITGGRQRLEFAGVNPLAYFGASVALAGDLALVGAPGASIGSPGEANHSLRTGSMALQSSHCACGNAVSSAAAGPVQSMNKSAGISPTLSTTKARAPPSPSGTIP